MKTKLIAEIGINGNGNMDLTKKMIDVAVLGKCWAVKFQKRSIEKVYSKEELDKPRESPWGKTNRDQKRGLEYTLEQYKEIDAYCKQKNIKWYCSPWDVDSVDFLMQFDIPFIKIASASLTDIELLEKIKKTGKPVILATGMSNEQELDRALEIFGNQVEYILSCTSSYPTPSEEMNMSRILTLKRKYGDKYKIGFSNHSPGIIFIVTAFVLGCEMLEFHITMDRASYGSDQASSLEPQGVLKIKSYIEDIQKGWGDGEIKCLKSEESVKAKLRKK